MQSILDMCGRMGSMCAIYMIDIDFFKEYNDVYGHIQGDVVLTKIARCIAGTFGRSSDAVARVGGEEFGAMAIVPDKQTALSLAFRLREEVRALGIPAGKRTVSDMITMSIGVEIFTPQDRATNHTPIESLMDCADRQMYIAKNKGRDAVACQGELHGIKN